MQTFDEFRQGLIEPGFLMCFALYYYAIVVYETIFVQKTPLKLLDINAFKQQGFARFWINFAVDRPKPADNELIGSSSLAPPLLKEARGVVLDVGPGTGSQLPYFGRNPNVTMMYGAEPVVALHAEINRRVRKSSLGFDYKVLACGAEQTSLIPALAKEGLLKQGQYGEVFDSIVCIRVLCSVPHPEETILGLYAMLKPGGKLLVLEHVRNPWRTQGGSIIARVLQSCYMLLGYSFLMGECNLVRDTGSMLMAAAKKDGGWASSTLKPYYNATAMPYIAGALTKKGKA